MIEQLPVEPSWAAHVYLIVRDPHPVIEQVPVGRRESVFFHKREDIFQKLHPSRSQTHGGGGCSPKHCAPGPNSSRQKEYLQTSQMHTYTQPAAHRDPNCGSFRCTAPRFARTSGMQDIGGHPFVPRRKGHHGFLDRNEGQFARCLPLGGTKSTARMN